MLDADAMMSSSKKVNGTVNVGLNRIYGRASAKVVVDSE